MPNDVGVNAWKAGKAIIERKRKMQEIPAPKPESPEETPTHKSGYVNKGNSQDHLTREQAEAIRKRKSK